LFCFTYKGSVLIYTTSSWWKLGLNCCSVASKDLLLQVTWYCPLIWSIQCILLFKMCFCLRMEWW